MVMSFPAATFAFSVVSSCILSVSSISTSSPPASNPEISLPDPVLVPVSQAVALVPPGILRVAYVVSESGYFNEVSREGSERILFFFGEFSSALGRMLVSPCQDKYTTYRTVFRVCLASLTLGRPEFWMFARFPFRKAIF